MRRQGLTGADLEMVSLFAEGWTDRRIGAYFGATRSLIYYAFERMMAIKRVGSRAELVALASLAGGP